MKITLSWNWDELNFLEHAKNFNQELLQLRNQTRKWIITFWKWHSQQENMQTIGDWSLQKATQVVKIEQRKTLYKFVCPLFVSSLCFMFKAKPGQGEKGEPTINGWALNNNISLFLFVLLGGQKDIFLCDSKRHRLV